MLQTLSKAILVNEPKIILRLAVKCNTD